MQIYRYGALTADFFAHEDTQRGGVNVAWHAPTEELYTGAGYGGGPVLKIYNYLGIETVPARWIGHPDDRNGSNPIPIAVMTPGPPVPVPGPPVPGPPVPVPGPPVPVPGPPVPVEVPVEVPVVVAAPDFNRGPIDDPAYHLIFLNVEAPLSHDEQVELATKFWAMIEQYLPGLPIALTMRRPDYYPAGYGELLYGHPLGFTRDQWPPNGAGGVCLRYWWQDLNNQWECRPVIQSHTNPPYEPMQSRANGLFHEMAHAYGWPGSHPGNEGWSETALSYVRPNVPIAATVAAKYRPPQRSVAPPAGRATPVVAEGMVVCGSEHFEARGASIPGGHPPPAQAED